MNTSRDYAMNALVAHPDVMRWFIWAWNPASKLSKYQGVTELFRTILCSPINITITNNTISIFEGLDMDMARSPSIVRGLFSELTMKKSEYFELIENNPIFRNIRCSKCVLNHHLENNIDRLGWLSWGLYWILKSQPSKFFITKDIMLLSLRPLLQTKVRNSNDPLPLSPWIKQEHMSIQGIYDRMNHSIYYECLGS